ncbi:hypothetical protein A1O1_00070 [Capronia coronata CBS 617.96]|uniref:Amine oxidase n=1 Tax=Capronia coronata CBS 617.96 TaxID=1182541 RepID=W9YPW9_9EURO|nr:uncharacterized protein A1O1_00070 [Capronia coronata CBS 617.96]EXJ94952.1 hypothetical protein A1O1_00070 [Capronia coronata CBS 617.96]
MASWKHLSLSISAILLLSTSLAYLLLSLAPHTPSHLIKQHQSSQHSPSPAASASCSPLKDYHQGFHAPAKNPWIELDEEEASQISAFFQETYNLKRDTHSESDSESNDASNDASTSKSSKASSKSSKTSSKASSNSTPVPQIHLIELLRPNKSDVVNYLDSNGPLPERWARVSNLEYNDSTNEVFIAEYMVGPLPAVSVSSVEGRGRERNSQDEKDTDAIDHHNSYTKPQPQIHPLTYCYNSGRNRVQTPLAGSFALLEWALSIGENASDITQDLLGAATNRDDPSDPAALVMGSRPALIEAGRMVHWLEFFSAGIASDSRSLLPQGLYVKVETPTPDPTTWMTKQWFYNGVLYDNDTALRDAMAEPGFVRLERNLDGEWTDTEEFDTDADADTNTEEFDTDSDTDADAEFSKFKSDPSRSRSRSSLPPISIQPYGPRYHLDRHEQYLSWMGFSFYLSTNQATGLSLFDIRYNNSRLIYQLGLQEALAHYAGVEPMQSGLEFLDAFFGMGSMMFSLVPGHDCPGHAEYLGMWYHKGPGGKMYRNRNAICVFEYTSDAPLQRHTSAFSATVSRNTYLVVRSVSTVGNYDYTIDYIFYLDGSIEVKLRASGFIFGAFHAEPRSSSSSSSSSSSPSKREAHTSHHNPPSPNTNPNEYGYRIHPAVHTSMHDHVVSFRADLDICGPSNTLIRTAIEPLTQSYDWDRPEIPGPRNTMHMVHTPVTHETGLNWPRNSGEMYLITNPNATNRWGETRAYRILPGTGMGSPASLTIVNSTTLGRSAAWASSDLWILKNRPVTEPAGAHAWNYLQPLDPLVDFEKMVDGEPIEEEDLVVYFNLGGHHVPTTQDVPNTLMHTSASSVMFVPFNYFDHDVSRAVRQGVRVDRRKKWGKKEEEKKKKKKKETSTKTTTATTTGRGCGGDRHGGQVETGDEDGKEEREKGKDEIRRTAALGRGRHTVRNDDTDEKIDMATEEKRPEGDDSDDDDDNADITYFGGHYTSPVLVSQEMLSPDLSNYMKERDEEEVGGWKTVRNRVGGGLLGLFVGKERGELGDEDNDGDGDADRGRMDW